MQREQHLEQLGLASNANNADIQATISKKCEQLHLRLTNAPSEALQAKYQAALTCIAASEAVLLATNSTRDRSAFLFDDMPQTASQFDGDIKFMDVGIAQVQSTSQRTKTGAAMGTTNYMAPEQLKGLKDIDGRAVQYTLTVITYERLSGELPAGRIEKLSQLNKVIPRRISDAVDKALSAKQRAHVEDVTDLGLGLMYSARNRPTLPRFRPKTLGFATGIIGLLATGAFPSQAGQHYQKVQSGYNQLLNYFNAASQLEDAIAYFIKVRNQWQDISNQYHLADSVLVSAAIERQQQALAERKSEIANGNKQKELENLAGATKTKQEEQTLQAQIAAVKTTFGQLVTIPSGSFMMGCSDSYHECYEHEKPQHQVHIKSFKLMSTEVTFAMWDACVNAGGCSHQPEDEGKGRDNRPVVNVGYDDVTQQFIPWLNKTTGQQFRLPTEAEWEYAARARSTTKYSWGDTISCSQAQYSQLRTGIIPDGICGNARNTVPVKSFSANQFGLYDMHGNVYEWTADCWNENYQGAPTDGRAWLSGNCKERVLRGGSWHNEPRDVRSSKRFWFGTWYRFNNYGFRLAHDL